MSIESVCTERERERELTEACGMIGTTEHVLYCRVITAATSARTVIRSQIYSLTEKSLLIDSNIICCSG
jgi:hypothetical protein